MSLKPSLAIDNETQTAELKLFVSGVLATTYSYAGGYVTLSARPVGIEVGAADFTANVEAIERWLLMIRDYLAPGEYARCLFTGKITAESNKIKCSLELDNAQMIDAVYKDATKLTTFGSRPQFVASVPHFRVFAYHLRRLLNEITNTYRWYW